MPIKFKDKASTQLSADFGSSAVTLTVKSGKGVLFPIIDGASNPNNDYFYVTLEDASGNLELVKCAHRTTGSDVLGHASYPLVRDVDGRNGGGRNWLTNDIVAMRCSSYMLEYVLNAQTTLETNFPGLSSNRAFREQQKSGNYTLAATDNLTIIECTAELTISGTASTLGNGFMCIIRNTTTTGVPVTMPTGTCQSGDEAIIYSDGTNWAYLQFRRATSQFIVNRNGSTQSITASTQTKIQFNNEVIDSGGWFDNATNYRLTPKVSSGWLIGVTFVGNPQTDNAACIASIYKNGAVANSYCSRATAAGANMSTSVQALVQFNGTTDYVEGYAYIDGSTNRTIAGEIYNTYMWGYRVW